MKSKYCVLVCLISTLLICSKLKSQTTIINNEKDTLIPFTTDILEYCKKNNLDVRRLQFYIDNSIELIPQNYGPIRSGDVLINREIDIIWIDKLIPCIVKEVKEFDLLVAFSKTTHLEFAKKDSVYKLLASKKGKNENIVVLNDINYKIKCLSCIDTFDVGLLIRKKDLELKFKTFTSSPRRITQN